MLPGVPPTGFIDLVFLLFVYFLDINPGTGSALNFTINLWKTGSSSAEVNLQSVISEDLII